MLWISAIIMATWEKCNELQDPTYNHVVDTTHYYVSDALYRVIFIRCTFVSFQTLKVFFFTFGAIYLAYLLLLILRAYSELRAMPFFGKDRLFCYKLFSFIVLCFFLDMRLKFLTLLMLVVLSISLTITVLRFGVGVLEDNFVAQLSTQYNSSAQFMSFYGLLNFYIYAMAYVYSPGNQSIAGK